MYSTVHCLMKHYVEQVELSNVQYSTLFNEFNNTVLTLFSAIRTVAEGHQMVADGWKLFEEAVESVGAGDLPQLLRSVRSMTTPPPPTPAPSPVPALMDVTPTSSQPDTSQAASPVKTEGEEPVVVLVGGEKLGLPPV